jgi:hypothetical protein
MNNEYGDSRIQTWKKGPQINNIWSVIVFWLSKSHMVSFVGLLRKDPLNSTPWMRDESINSSNKTTLTPSCIIIYYIIVNLRTKNECGPSHFHVNITFTSRATVSPCLCTFFFSVIISSVLWILLFIDIDRPTTIDVDFFFGYFWKKYYKIK